MYGRPDTELPAMAAAERCQPHWGLGWRHVTCTLVFLIVVICYADRTNIGIVLAQADFPGIPHEEKGNILSAFFVGYFCTQILGGFLARRWGSKPTLLLAAAVWTLFDVLTPLAARLGVGWLILDRFAMGLGEGLMFPTQHAFSSFWVPKHERAFLITFMTSGQDLGSVAANVVSPHLVNAGIAWVFVFWGGLAIAWFLLFSALGASAPEVHKKCARTGEALWIQQQRGAAHFEEARRVGEFPLPRRLLREPCVWAIFAGHVGCNYAWYVMLSWMPTFFKGRYSLHLGDNPVILAAPYLASWAGGLLGGRSSDALVARGFRTRRVRKAVHVAGALGNAFFLQLAARSGTPGTAALWISLGAFMGRMQNAGYWVNMVDICPESAATIMGMSNTMGTIPGIIGQPITQAILAGSGGDHSVDAWAIVFGIGGAVGALGALTFMTFGDDVSLDKPAQASADHADQLHTIGGDSPTGGSTLEGAPLNVA